MLSGKMFSNEDMLHEAKKNEWFGLVWFDGISTIVGHLMPNTLYTSISNMICKHILLITFLNKPQLILFAHS